MYGAIVCVCVTLWVFRILCDILGISIELPHRCSLAVSNVILVIDAGWLLVFLLLPVMRWLWRRRRQHPVIHVTSIDRPFAQMQMQTKTHPIDQTVAMLFHCQPQNYSIGWHRKQAMLPMHFHSDGQCCVYAVGVAYGMSKS